MKKEMRNENAVSPTENDVRAAMAEGKKLVVLSEVDDYELCVPEDGFRPVDSFWRKKEKSISALVAVVKMSEPRALPVREAEPHESPAPEMRPETRPEVRPGFFEPPLAAELSPAEPVTEPDVPVLAATVVPVKLRLVPQRYGKYEVPDGIERDEKICIDCGFPYPLGAFYTNTATKDGRQSRCKECDKKRRTEYNRGLHVKVSERDDYVRDGARKQAMEATVPAAAADKPYIYKGVSGGFLIYGFVK